MSIITKDDDGNPAAVIGFNESGAGVIWLRQPTTCSCGKMCFLVVNRMGKSRCIDCDTIFEEELKKKQGVLVPENKIR